MTRVHYGCGDKVGASWMNFDASPMLRIERLPIVGKLLRSMAGGGIPFPAGVRYGDITQGPLVEPGTASAVFASHVLEHLSLTDARAALRNSLAMLAPGGVFRVIVPDLHERVVRYLAELQLGEVNAASNFMRYCLLGHEERPRGIRAVRKTFSGSSHLWMYDRVSMRAELQNAGFSSIRECSFGDAEDPAFSEIEDQTRFVEQWFKMRECAFEARRS